VSSSAQEKMKRYRAKLRAAGLRPVQIWIPDTRSKALAREARRQSVLASRADEPEWMDLHDQAAAETEGWE